MLNVDMLTHRHGNQSSRYNISLRSNLKFIHRTSTCFAICVIYRRNDVALNQANHETLKYIVKNSLTIETF